MQNTECIGKFFETAKIIARRQRKTLSELPGEAGAEYSGDGEVAKVEAEGLEDPTRMTFITSET